MAPKLPPSFPREAISLLSILLVVFLVCFPSAATQAAVFIVVGGGALLLLSGKGNAEAKQVQLQELSALQSPVLARLAAKQARESQAQSPSLEKQDLAPPVTEEPGKAAGRLADSSPAPIEKRETASAAELEEPAPPAPTEDVKSAPKAAQAPSNPSLAGGAAVLARLRQQKAAAAKAAAAAAKEDAAREVTVAYASQTGTAQEIARGIQAESASHGIKSKVMSLNELGFDTVKAGKSPILVIVAASTGDGDSPDNGAKFYAALRRRSEAAGVLKGVKYTVLGLGDSNYTRFMGVSRSIRTRMQELGGEPFYNMGEADEVDGLESVVDPWVAGLWDALKKLTVPESKAAGDAPAPAAAAEEEKGLVGVPALAACRIAVRWLGDAVDSTRAGESGHPTEAELAVRDSEGRYSPAAPFWAPVTAATYLTAPTSDRKVLHVELDLSGSGMEYVPGDSLGVTALNEDGLVDALLSRLGANGSSRFEVVPADGSSSQQGLLPHLGCPTSLRHALQAGCDLTSVPRKSLLRLLGEHCSDAEERRQLLHLSSRGGREEYGKLAAAAPSLLDLLRRFPSCSPPLAPLLDALPPLAPRLYSVSSSPLEHPGRAHVAFSVVRIEPSPDRLVAARQGVATGWLERLVEPVLSGEKGSRVRVPVHLRKGGAFAHPSDLSAPLLMIGPGTGVTPFRGFLQHRRQLLKSQQGAEVGPTRLFFGCRRPEEDFLYKAELEEFAADGTLSSLEVAFSRAGPEKVYVQHLMRKQAEELQPIVANSKAFLFICGDGANMAKDVHAALLEILQHGGKMSAAEATAHLADMTKAGHYVRDIWS